MENPTYKKLVAMLAASVTGNDKMRHHVIKAMQEQVVPAIARLTKPQLVEALAEAVYCIHGMEEELRSYEGTDGIIKTKHNEMLSWKLTSAHLENELKANPKKVRKASSKNALDVKYKDDRERKEAILAEWASGEHESRNSCARDTWVQIGFESYDTARNQLDNAPAHNPHPAKPKKKK